jgi:hypothetical protein
MTNLTKQKPPLWFWIVSGFALIWNALGVNQYLHQAYKTDYFKSLYPDPKIMDIVLNTPSWVMAAYATAVIFGALGSLLLLLRKKWAHLFLFISLLGIMTQMVHTLFMSGALEIYGPGAIIMPVFVLIVGISLLLLSRTAVSKLWIN